MKIITKWKPFFIAFCIVALFGLAASPVSAQIPVALFEMDGNTSSEGNLDWQTAGPIPSFSGIITDTTDRTFKKGSKDTQDVSQWNWDFFNTVTPKDDIQHAYALHRKSGDDYLYFGLDRLAGSSGGGTTSFGFWAFQDNVALIDPDKITSDEFTGIHKEGDILVTGDIGGNTIEGLRVYVWAGGDGTAGSLTEITGSASITSDCSDSQSGGQYLTDACGEINTVPINLGFDGTVEAGRFVEIALNYTELVGPLPCFNTFMATTRTANSERSSIKNFLLDSFPVCSIDVSKVCATVALVDPFAEGGPTYRTEFTATVENDGGAAFSSAAVITVVDAAGTVFDDDNMDPNDDNDITVVRNVNELTGPNNGMGADGFQSGEELVVLASGLTITGSYVSTDNGGMNSVKASISDGPLAVQSGTFTATCTKLELTPALFIEKDCDNINLVTRDPADDSLLDHIGVSVDYDIRSCNTGQFPLKVALADATVGLDTDGTEILLQHGTPCGGPAGPCPTGSACVGFNSNTPLVPGVCVHIADTTGQTGPDREDSSVSVNVCKRVAGDYLLEALESSAASATPFNAIFSNTATVSASESDNPLLDVRAGIPDDIMESATAACPLCDEDEDGIPDYIDDDSGGQ